MFIVLGLIVYNSFVDFVVVLVEMRRETNDEFVEKSTDAVDVSESVVTLAHEDFWAHVLRTSAERM